MLDCSAVLLPGVTKCSGACKIEALVAQRKIRPDQMFRAMPSKEARSLFLFGFDMLTMHSIERKKDDVCNTIT
jgi:hypothetical protein